MYLQIETILKPPKIHIHNGLFTTDCDICSPYIDDA